MQDTPVLMANQVVISELLAGVGIAKVHKGQKYPKDRKTKETYYYLDIVTAFDIETSKEKYGPAPTEWRSWLYVWQWQFGEIATVIGRTWEEFLSIVNQINAYLSDNVRLMVYVHSLAYEFQFISGVWNFASEDVFATDVRSPLYCRMGKLELRCSYRLSNYGLGKWAKECKADHSKMIGDLDYNVVRYPWTDLTPEELRYCINDVICVVECVEIMLESYNDTLYSIPYTNTGYIRRRVRNALKMWSYDAVKQMCGDLLTYDRLRQAFRGGNTHANRWHVTDLLGDVYSYDRSSSYPDVMCHCKFPMSKFKAETPDIETLQKCIDRGRACLLKVGFWNIRLKSDRIGLPYIPFDKCCEVGFNKPKGVQLDNGRILLADYLEIAITDIDMEIIQEQYVWDAINVQWLMSARYGYLPKPLQDVLISLYTAKTSLKGIEGEEVTYNHAKAELNSCYGMMVQRVFTNPIMYKKNHWRVGKFKDDLENDPSIDKDFVIDSTRLECYDESISHAFVCYQWGVWVTAWARYRLQEGVKLAEKADPDNITSPFRVCGYGFG